MKDAKTEFLKVHLAGYRDLKTQFSQSWDDYKEALERSEPIEVLVAMLDEMDKLRYTVHAQALAICDVLSEMDDFK